MIKKITSSTLTVLFLLVGCGSDSDEEQGLNKDNKVVLSSENLNNYEDTFAPKIGYFEVIGNNSPQNGKAVISKSTNGGRFSYQIILKDEIYTNRLYSSLNDAKRGAILEYDISMGKVFNFDCKLNRLSTNEKKGVDYTCNDIKIKNNQGENDTYMRGIACDDTEDKCSVALIPILFVE